MKDARWADGGMSRRSATGRDLLKGRDVSVEGHPVSATFWTGIEADEVCPTSIRAANLTSTVKASTKSMLAYAGCKAVQSPGRYPAGRPKDQLGLNLSHSVVRCPGELVLDRQSDE